MEMEGPFTSKEIRGQSLATWTVITKAHTLSIRRVSIVPPLESVLSDFYYAC